MAYSLSPEDRQKLIDLEAIIPEAEAELQRAERAGLDVTDLRKKFEQAKTIRDGLLREYS